VKWPGVFSYLLYGSWDFPPAPPSYPTFVADDPPQHPYFPADFSGADPNAASDWTEQANAQAELAVKAEPNSMDGVAPQTPPGGTEDEEGAVRAEIESSRARIRRQQALEAQYAAPPPWRNPALKVEKVEKPPEPKEDPLVAAVQKSAAVPLEFLN